jgi:putative redox protein
MATEATATLIDAMQFAIETGGGHCLVVDSEKKEFGGRNTGPRPIDLMAASIAGCTAMDVISILRKMQQQVTGLQVKVSSRDAEEHPKRLLEVQIRYIVTGVDIDPKKLARAVELSETHYCPAMATINPDIRIDTGFEIVEVGAT